MINLNSLTAATHIASQLLSQAGPLGQLAGALLGSAGKQAVKGMADMSLLSAASSLGLSPQETGALLQNFNQSFDQATGGGLSGLNNQLSSLTGGTSGLNMPPSTSSGLGSAAPPAMPGSAPGEVSIKGDSNQATVTLHPLNGGPAMSFEVKGPAAQELKAAADGAFGNPEQAVGQVLNQLTGGASSAILNGTPGTLSTLNGSGGGVLGQMAGGVLGQMAGETLGGAVGGALAGPLGEAVGQALGGDIGGAVGQLGGQVLQSANQSNPNAQNSLNDMMTMALGGQGQQSIGGGHAAGKGSWLEAIAQAMGTALGQMAQKMVNESNALQGEAGNASGGAANNSGGSDAQKFQADMAQFQADSQMFQMLNNAFATAIKGIGEGMASMASKQ